MQTQEQENTLYIPVNIKTRFEFFDGFGFSELAITAVMAMLSIGIAIIIKSITGDFYKSVLLVLISISITAMAVRKNEFNQSITDMIVLFFRFINTQQTFDYQYKSNLPLALEKENLWQ